MANRELVVWGTKRLEDMTKPELIAALKKVYEHHLLVFGQRLGSEEVPVFHEDMDKWNDQLRIWFYGDYTT
jgi:hypothetical protein